MLYTMTRLGEARVLECSVVDIAFGNGKVLKASDSQKKGATKSTKSGKARIVSLEPNLSPTLHELIADQRATRE